MYYEQFDICESYYLFAMYSHRGRGSKVYALHSVFERIRFRPSPMLSNRNDLSENGQAIYDNLIATDGANIRDRRR